MTKGAEEAITLFNMLRKSYFQWNDRTKSLSEEDMYDASIVAITRLLATAMALRPEFITENKLPAIPTLLTGQLQELADKAQVFAKGTTTGKDWFR